MAKIRKNSVTTDKCYFTQSNSTQKYGLAGFVKMSPDSVLKLNCEVLNTSDKAIQVTPTYEIHYGSAYGEVLKVTDGDIAPLSFEVNKMKTISVVVPKNTTPGDYFLNFALVNDTYKSNTVSSSYNIKGPNARILNLSLDKDYYKKGETALLKLNYSNSNIKPLYFEVSILSSKNKKCSEVIKEDLSVFNPLVSISVPINSKCLNPQVLVKLTDGNGVVYSEKTFNVTSAPLAKKDDSNNKSLFIIILLAIILLGLLVVKIMKNNKKENNNSDSNTSVPMGMLFIGFMLLSFAFISNNKAEAVLFVSPDGDLTGVNLTLTNGIDYYSQADIAFTAGVDIKPLDIMGDPGNVKNIKLEVYATENFGNGYVYTPGATGNGMYGAQSTIKAGSTRGSDKVWFVVSYTYLDTFGKTRNKSVAFSLDYNVHKLGVTVNKVSKSALNCNAKDRIYWEAIDAVKCTACTMTNTKGTVPCPSGFNDNNSAPKIYGYFETDNITENTTFKITCDNNTPPVTPPVIGYSCQGTVVGSMDVNGGSAGPYEGQSCSQFATHSECVQKWYSHGCKWQSN